MKPFPFQTPVRVASAGEALMDLVLQADGRLQPSMGGAPYNLCRALARQTIGVAYLNPFSGDRHGRLLARQLGQEGVAHEHMAPTDKPTSLALVGVDEQGQPDYTFYREQVADRAISADQLIQACAGLHDLEVVYTGCLALAPADAGIYLPWLGAQKAAGRWVVVDANMRPGAMPDLATYRSHVMSVLSLADMVKVSDEDLEVLDVPGNDPLSRSQRLMESLPLQMMVLTMGARGAVLMHRQKNSLVRVAAREASPVKVVDTVGAGDCFLAGLLACLLRQSAQKKAGLVRHLGDMALQDLQELMAHALATATLNVQRIGCQPPRWQEVIDRLQSHPVQWV
jgi:fructokinase